MVDSEYLLRAPCTWIREETFSPLHHDLVLTYTSKFLRERDVVKIECDSDEERAVVKVEEESGELYIEVKTENEEFVEDGGVDVEDISNETCC